MSESIIVVEKLATPKRGTGQHLWHYIAYYEDEPNAPEFGQVANEAIQTLKHRRPR